MTTKFRSISSYFKPKPSHAGNRRLHMQGVIVRRNSRLLVPLPYIEKALAENPKSWGVAISSDGELLTNKGNDPTLELLTQTMKDYDKNDITFFLSTADTGVNNGDDVSPYTILSDGDKPLL